ncbi:hypothetical protein CCHL11_00014 [Colletotrichum chlorophyti]|uniref:Uncharacterized protein n=1 Tax=Colletotrichum chlorophyti TaxID=708187 RepID=A0A1Q8RVF2_9PEZI|nr:hypothetical protein CCHL11_00014 [Colletotrichum chlorophyti]
MSVAQAHHHLITSLTSSAQSTGQPRAIPPNGPDGYRPYENQIDQQDILYNRPWHIAKVVIRGFNLVSCCIVIGIAVFMFLGFYYVNFFLFSLLPAALAVIWDISELITICARGGRLGIHPGAHVGLHLVFFIAFMIATGYEAWWVIERESNDTYFGGNVITLQNIVLAFTALLFLGHFILFVRSCIDTHKQRNRPPIYMVPINAPPPMPAGSYIPYPYDSNRPQQPYASPQHELGQMSGANPAITVASPGPDGTYYGPGSRTS